MAKIDDIKSQEPDSRLASLGTVFRPGQRRIALPTSKQMSSHNEGNLAASVSAENASSLIDDSTPSSNIHFSKNELLTGQEIKLGTTQHKYSAQLDTNTQHNLAQPIVEINQLDMQNSNDLMPLEKGTETQPGTTRHKLEDTNNTSILNSYYPNQVDSHTEKNQSKNASLGSLLSNDRNYNSAQPNTVTQHNSTQVLDTTKHNPAQKSKSKENLKIQPGTTRHNPTPGPAQLDTVTRHNHSMETSSMEFQKRVNNLSGSAALILSFLCKKCLENNTNRVTISYRILSEITNINFNSIPTTCKRLRNTGFFELSGPKGGAQAVRHFDLSDNTIKVFANEFLNHKNPTILSRHPGTTRHNNPTQLDTWADTTAPSKLVSNINNNLLTKTNASESNNAELLEVTAVNIESLTKFHITRKQVQDIFNQKLNFTTHTLQDFVDRFAIYVSDPNNIKGVNSIPAIFVKMAQLASKGQDPLIDIETDTDRAVRERIERLKAMKDQRQQQEGELIALEFENWHTCLTNIEMDLAVPPTPAAKSGSSTQKLLLKNYYLENVWPEKRAEIYGSKVNSAKEFTNLLEI
jgi:hypothetical protein